MTTQNRVIPADELIDIICRDRQIVNKNNYGFSDPVLKQKHDEIDFKKEVERINKEFGLI